MLVTIYTDASIKNENNGTYAFRAKSNNGLITGKGNINENIGNSTNKAEHYAIRIAIKSVIKKWSNAKVFFVNTDSLNCCRSYWKLSGLETKKASTSKDIVDDVRKVLKYFNENNLIIRLKHVKAHTGKNDTRSWLNNWCDQNT